jgi:hypothetical protein
MEHINKLNTYDSHVYSDNILNTLLDIVKSSNKNRHITKIINMDLVVFNTYRNTLQSELEYLNKLLFYLTQSEHPSPIIKQEIKQLKIITTNLKKIIYSLSDL